MPIYRVDEKGSDTPRMVEAVNPAAALRHVASSHFTVSKPLNAGGVAKLMGAGAKLETAGAEPEAAPAGDGGDDAGQAGSDQE